MTALISLIVPVYNVSEYLDRCVASMLLQDFKDIEILLIDDGSTDDSGEKCERWGKKDKRIQVFHKNNGGLSDARNYGLMHANAEYVTFIDSDDYIDKSFCSTLYFLAVQNHAQIAACGTRIVYESGKEKVNNDRLKDITVDSLTAFQYMLYENGITNSAWGKIYVRSLFDCITYPVGKYCEDAFTTYKLILKCSKIAITNKALYNYYIRKNSILGQADITTQLDLIEACDEIDYLVHEKFPSLISASRYKKFIANISLIVKADLNDKSHKVLIDKAWKYVKKNRIKIMLDSRAGCKFKLLAFLSFSGKSLTKFIYTYLSRR